MIQTQMGQVNMQPNTAAEDSGIVNKPLWQACEYFRQQTNVSDYRIYPLTLLFIKYISDIWQQRCDFYTQSYNGQSGRDEQQQLIDELLKNERFVVPAKANFEELYQRRFEPGNGERIDLALELIEDANKEKLSGNGQAVFQHISFNSNDLGSQVQKNITLRMLLEVFNKPFTNVNLDTPDIERMYAGLYQSMLEKFAANDNRDFPEILQTSTLSNLFSELMEPQAGESICDPFCGTATLLLSCADYIEQNSGSRQYALYGQESLYNHWSMAKMNLLIHAKDNHKIVFGDTFLCPGLLNDNDGLQLFDVAISCLPLRSGNWGLENAKRDRYGRFQRGLPPANKGSFASIQHMIETLKPPSTNDAGGRMAVLVPQGVLFRGAGEARIRQKLIEENLLEAVIGMPDKLFHHSSNATAILIFRRQKLDSKVLFIDANQETHDSQSHNLLTKTLSQKIVHCYKKRKTKNRFAYIATSEEIHTNEFNLTISRYVSRNFDEKPIDLNSLNRQRETLKSKISKLDREITGYLKAHGIE